MMVLKSYKSCAPTIFETSNLVNFSFLMIDTIQRFPSVNFDYFRVFALLQLLLTIFSLVIFLVKFRLLSLLTLVRDFPEFVKNTVFISITSNFWCKNWMFNYLRSSQ